MEQWAAGPDWAGPGTGSERHYQHYKLQYIRHFNIHTRKELKSPFPKKKDCALWFVWYTF